MWRVKGPALYAHHVKVLCGACMNEWVQWLQEYRTHIGSRTPIEVDTLYGPA